MRIQIEKLRQKMKEHGIDAYMIPTTDFHGSEYVNDHFKCREYISGFTGSAGTLLVEKDHAGLWTDGRYFLQAERELEGSGITLMKMGVEGVPDLLSYIRQQKDIKTVGFDGRTAGWRLGGILSRYYDVVYDLDLAGEIWEDRPELKASEIYGLDESVTGEDYHSKLSRIRAQMGDADYFLASRLEDVAWTYNLRADDIANTPVFYSYALISAEDDRLYVLDESFRKKHSGDDEWNSRLRDYRSIGEDLAALRNCTVLIDINSASFSILNSFDKSVKVRLGQSPAERLKAVKNSAEIKATENAHIRDGAAMVNMLYWLKSNIGKMEISEISLADHLEELRRRQGAYDLSFPTIAGYGPNGAIVHYTADEESNTVLKDEGLILIDSGGQYPDGTTDITRTVALGKLSSSMKTHYTAVLKAHLALAAADFTSEDTGADIDKTARKPLRDLGLDFMHGTGHGVGHMLSVHEGPNNISPRSDKCHIVPGMITSNEPGVYIEGEYGIRIENEILCVANGERNAFRTITVCPYEPEAIDISMLTGEELTQLNEYHAHVYETLAPLLDEPVRAWLEVQCRELHS